MNRWIYGYLVTLMDLFDDNDIYMIRYTDRGG